MKNSNIQQYTHIENELSRKLASVQPKNDYVENLRNRLVAQSNLVLDDTKWKKTVFITTAGLVSFVVATILLIKYIISFFNDEDE